MTMTMTKVKETSGTVVFKETSGPGNQDPVRPHQFYIMKPAWEGLGKPDTITVTMEAA